MNGDAQHRDEPTCGIYQEKENAEREGVEHQ